MAGLPARAPRPHRSPLDLPRLVMRGAAGVALAVLLLALGLGLARMGHDIDDEADAAYTLARLVAQLAGLAQTDDARALAALRALEAEHPPRHLLLRVQAADGRLLLGPPPLAEPEAPMRWLLALHRRLLSAPDARQVAWTVARPAGAPWTVSLAASHESERREAMGNLVGTLALLLAGVVGLLLAMRWNLRRAFAPLDRLVAAISGIAGIEGPDARAAVQALPPMPIRELAVIADALQRLAVALDAAEARRRLLSQQVLTLQEDERARLARELHDEFGQQLTALRVDAAWLARRLADQPEPAQVVAGMAAACARIQQDIRSLLARLQPFGPGVDAADGGAAGAGEPLARLAALLQALVAGWAQAPGGGVVQLVLDWQDGDRAAALQPWPAGAAAEALRLPPALALTLYRISQEALTNVARHAQARRATLCLRLVGPCAPGAPAQIDWSVQDDGVGLPAGGATARGNGLAGIRERVWAQGADLQCTAATADPARPGLRLAARFAVTWAPPALSG